MGGWDGMAIIGRSYSMSSFGANNRNKNNNNNNYNNNNNDNDNNSRAKNGSLTKIGVVWQKSEFWTKNRNFGPKKEAHFLGFTKFWPRPEKVVQRKKILCPNNQGGKCHFG